MNKPAVAIVTGAARGIGAATARRLASDGYSVAVVDLDASGAQACAKQIAVSGATSAAYTCDVADEGSVSETIACIASELGPPLVLVNNAGVLRDNLLFKMKADEWDTVMNVHLRGAFLMSKYVQRHMVAASWGRIINLSSTSALGKRGQSNYSAAKAGIQGLTKTMAIELGKFGITCNAIAPGFIETDMTRATAARLGISFEDLRKRAEESIPVRRVGQPEDVAALVSFFARDESSFVSGQVVYVAGGPRA